MAAILCRGFCDVIRGVCDALGKVICFPCKLCGIATAELSDIVCSPFFLYLSVSYGLNLPPIVFAFKAWGIGREMCKREVDWLIINAALSAVNMVAAAYIVNRIQADNDIKRIRQQEEDGTWYNSMRSVNENNTRSNSISRIKQVLGYDPVVAIFILIWIFYIVWTSIGMSLLQANGSSNQMGEYMENALLFNVLFLSFGGLAFCCSACCL